MAVGKLLSDSQVAAIQKTGLLGMQTPVQILRGDPSTGLELTDDPYGSSPGTPEAVTPPMGVTVKGWLHSTPTPTQTVDHGREITINTYRLWVPVGTDILPRDRVVIGTQTYIVTDTTADSTWPAVLNCSLRLAE